MAEQSSVNEHSIEIEQTKKKKLIVPSLLEGMKNLPSSVPSSPSGLSKSTKYNCLCSPTTHAGSFRCRYHRSSSLTRNSMSVGSKLSELAAGK
uniref:PGPS/D10 n=1 Tax=Petunia hybrida TaxID=4102 RepID=Q9ZTM9_PETHY|nr:PGPS/D10 [Petunia x hybrida]